MSATMKITNEDAKIRARSLFGDHAYAIERMFEVPRFVVGYFSEDGSYKDMGLAHNWEDAFWQAERGIEI